MGRRTALLISGTLKSFRPSLPLFLKHVVEPANADLFLYLKPGSEWRDRSSGQNHEQESAKQVEALLRSTFGARIKELVWANEVPGKELVLDHVMNLIEDTWTLRYGSEVIGRLQHSDRGQMSKNVDQYCRLRACCRLMTDYCAKQGFAYDSVFRMRLDVHATRPLNWHQWPLAEGAVRVHPGSDGEVRDFMFLADGPTMVRLVETFLVSYCTYLPDDPLPTALSPEAQLAFHIDTHFKRSHLDWCLEERPTPIAGAPAPLSLWNVVPAVQNRHPAGTLASSEGSSADGETDLYLTLFIVFVTLFALTLLALFLFYFRCEREHGAVARSRGR